ncbi:MAG: acetylxylan esterase, partial [Planctomycetaceae bacterium]|nr:acetylxylan esterase [Planctomycetaceae bacterium]
KWKDQLQKKSFRGWLKKNDSNTKTKIETTTRDRLTLQTISFDSQKHVPLKLFLVLPENTKTPQQVTLTVLNQSEWETYLKELAPAFPGMNSETPLSPQGEKLFQQLRKNVLEEQSAIAYFTPRGVGLDAWNPEERKQTQIRRRFYLLGQSLEGMQIWDVRRAIQELQAQPEFSKSEMRLVGTGEAAALCLYASLFEKGINELDLTGMPATHQHGPALLNVLRFLDLPQALSMAASRSRVILRKVNPEDWAYSSQVGQKMGWDEKQLQISK